MATLATNEPKRLFVTVRAVWLVSTTAKKDYGLAREDHAIAATKMLDRSDRTLPGPEPHDVPVSVKKLE